MIRRLFSQLGLRRTPVQPMPSIAHGAQGIMQVGHREYVGGLWGEIGQLQFNLLLAHGLRPHHVFWDVACGSLRGGCHFIPYLDAGNYLGIDKEEMLIRVGIESELGIQLYEAKRPEFVVSDRFEFGRFSKKPQYALAQSLFTHLPILQIELCLDQLRKFVNAGCCFYVTFFESNTKVENPGYPHDHMAFRYTRDELELAAAKLGWAPKYGSSPKSVTAAAGRHSSDRCSRCRPRACDSRRRGG
jgi:hypothetical protein